MPPPSPVKHQEERVMVVIDNAAVQAVSRGEHSDPFAVLVPHGQDSETVVLWGQWCR